MTRSGHRPYIGPSESQAIANAWRQELVAKYGEAVVADIERSVPPNPFGCKDTMDGRHWCRTHDAFWPSFSGQACEAAKASIDEP